VLDKNLEVRSANPVFFRVFKVSADDTIGRRIFELGDQQWDIPRLRTLLEDILKRNSSFEGFEVEHVFPNIGRKKMLLNARRLTFAGIEMILLSIEDVSALSD